MCWPSSGACGPSYQAHAEQTVLADAAIVLRESFAEARMADDIARRRHIGAHVVLAKSVRSGRLSLARPCLLDNLARSVQSGRRCQGEPLPLTCKV